MTNLTSSHELTTLDLASFADDNRSGPRMPEFAARLVAIGDQLSRTTHPDWDGDQVLGFTLGVLLATHPDPLVAAVCRQGAVQLAGVLGLMCNRMRVSAHYPDGFPAGFSVTAVTGEAYTMSSPFTNERFGEWLLHAVRVLAGNQSDAMLWMSDADLERHRAEPFWALRRGAGGGPFLPDVFLDLGRYVLEGGDTPAVPDVLR
ncbi:hypothetical protein [Deinococcus soli (ex Cha et al. 2016)]|uniref:Uncharacterized protein n=2 Tax=Deinococcus soli (ex Cha et al. 2016) TaxID=1309411 RepID=A0ACC6KL02_9DEIO|nr:hypothetical protein [Deinococcus soli (ex Cha et al. 2016)]MDR6218692.1 hypothetical protein [Deinococcus soli (ex Cha et al. 2016)]MDR6328489.1 hypothetical protein [Deinococcus soli (ex Cha et al. 2016)]MDR6753100.1 hypothetical protein [Deinococcus soli (ex Cha et al. 2016)]